jgi:hypothetical protein
MSPPTTAGLFFCGEPAFPCGLLLPAFRIVLGIGVFPPLATVELAAGVVTAASLLGNLPALQNDIGGGSQESTALTAGAAPETARARRLAGGLDLAATRWPDAGNDT